MDLKPYLLTFINLWPPFLFTGIKVEKMSKDYRHLVVKLKLRFYNANYVGTQFGGAIFSMADPFYMVMLLNNLGPEYSVWDKSASIRYVKPGKTDLIAEFLITEQDLDSIRTTLQNQEKMEWNRKVIIKDKNGELIAEVDKTLSIKKRDTKKKD